MVTPNAESVGWRFRPTDEELINYFLAKKINGKEEDVRVIGEIDVCKSEPWDLPGQSILKSDDKEWFFFCPREKFPSSSRLNRATLKGFWKATGKDRKIRSKKIEIGIKKTLVFHTGRAPKGQRTYWIMHEYRATLKSLDGTHPGQRPFVLCRLFKKDDEFVLDAIENDVDLATPSPIPNEHSPMNSKQDPVSLQVGPFAAQEGERKITSGENWEDERCKTPSQDTFYDTVQNYPAGVENLEDVIKSIAVEVETQPQPDVDFDYDELFADLDPNEMSLLDSPALESLGSSLPYDTSINIFHGNEDLQLNFNKSDFDVLQSLFTNSPDSSCEDQGNNTLISAADYRSPQNEHMTQYENLVMDSGSFLKSNVEEAELNKKVAELEQYAFSAESDDLSRASKSCTSFQEFDKLETHPENLRGAFSGGSVLEHSIFSNDSESSSHASLIQGSFSTNRGIPIRHRRLHKHGTSQKRINLQTYLGTRLLHDASQPDYQAGQYEQPCTSEYADEKEQDVVVLQSGIDKTPMATYTDDHTLQSGTSEYADEKEQDVVVLQSGKCVYTDEEEETPTATHRYYTLKSDPGTSVYADGKEKTPMGIYGYHILQADFGTSEDEKEETTMATYTHDHTLHSGATSPYSVDGTYVLQSKSGTRSLNSGDGKWKVFKNCISSFIYSHKLILVVFSIVTIFAAYAGIPGCLSGR